MRTQFETTPANIAVIGMACRLPGAENPEQYWRNLREGVESITFYSDDELRERGVPDELLANPRYVKASGVFEDGEGFDAGFFGYTVREAEIMDPQHRHFLEVAYHALEDASYDPGRTEGMIGVYGGCTMNTYLPMNIIPHGGVIDVVGDLQIMLGGDKEYLPARVSYKLDLTGPSIAVQSACSTSLTAIHMASQAILNGECDMALAGGSSVRMPYRTGYLHQPGGTSSPDGHCRAFDIDSGGSVVGNGAGVVLLKHLGEALADGDHIYAVIRGTSINNDGSQKVSFTAPSVHGQARAAASALIAAEVTADDIGYVEAHGTGTPLGDPIEVAALTQAFRESTDKVGAVVLGSVKPNIGHLDAGAGVASFIKAIQALRYGMIPPTLHFREPNPQLGLEESPFFVNDELIDWPGPLPRRAGVNSVGMGGSNAHVILEEPPEQTPGDPAGPGQLLILSAHTATALEKMSDNLVRWLSTHPGANLADVAYTLQVGRRPLRHRRAVAVRDAEDADLALGTSGSSRVVSRRCDPPATGVAFLFPGQGSQYPGMAAALHAAFPVYRDAIDSCLAELSIGADLRHLLLEADQTDAAAAEQLRGTAVTQPALFVVEYAATVLLGSLGVEPAAMLGHSVGEYVAAVVADVLSLKDALRLVAERARIIADLPVGAMLSVPMSPADVQPYLEDGVDIAAVNTASLVTLSGHGDAVERVAGRLAAEGVRTRPLAVSHAFHSPMMDAALDAYGKVLTTVQFSPPKRRFISNLTGDWADPDECVTPDYWVRHLRGTVQFSAGCATLAREEGLVLIEVGPGKSLLSMARMTGNAAWSTTVPLQPGARDRGDGVRTFLQAVGICWTAGIGVDFFKFWGGSVRRRVPLPVYPFEHERYWLDPAPLPEHGPAPRPAPRPVAKPERIAPGAANKHRRPDISTLYVAASTAIETQIVSTMAELLSFDKVGVNDNFFDFDADSLMALQLVSRLRETYGIELPVAKLFGNPTAAGLAAVLEEELKDGRLAGGTAPPVPGGAPAGPSQQGPAPAVPPEAPTTDPDVDDLLRDASPEDLARLLDEIESETR
jgi:phthiocerol/phenolphthiocerol synthesis type-I polyketide synthase E